jgi:2'-5' RNA ligase
LGDLKDEQINELKIELEKINLKTEKIEFETTQIGAFPNFFDPKIIYLGSKQVNGNIAVVLYKEIAHACQNLNLEIEDRFWTPHLTLGRVKWQDGKIAINSNLISPLNFEVSSFELMESELTSDGPIYNVIKSFKLK